MTRHEWILTLAAAFVMAATTALLVVPLALEKTHLSPDAASYLGVANSLAHGNGFVAPIQWHFYLPGAPPQPAWAIVFPVITVVLAVPIWLGADVTTAIVCHSLIAAGVGGAIVVVARRFMSLPAAVAAGAGLAWSTRWSQVSTFAWTEPYAVLGILLIVATACGVSRSYRGALVCAAVTVFGWLTRANVPLLGAVVVLAVLWEKRRPLREGIRDRRLWIYVAAVATGILGLRLAYELVSGLRPYAAYAAFFEMFQPWDLVFVDKQYVGALAFMRANWTMVTAAWAAFVKISFRELFLHKSVHFAGFLLPVVVTWGIFGRSGGGGDIPRRVAALGAVAFLLNTILIYGGFEARYLLPAACCLWLAGAGSLDQLARKFSPRPGLAQWSLLAVLLIVLATTLPMQAKRSLVSWWAYSARGETLVVFRPKADDDLRRMCAFMNPDYVGVATEGEALHFWCGNPTLRLPRDLGVGNALERFIDQRGPRYFVIERGDPRFATIHSSARLKHLSTTPQYMLYEVVDFSRPPAWRAPPALACIGTRPPMCPEGAPGSTRR